MSFILFNREITVILSVPRNRKLKPKRSERKKYFLIFMHKQSECTFFSGLSN